MEEQLSLVKVHKKYILGTQPKASIVKKTFLLTLLTKAVARAISTENLKVYITTIALKHMYDKRPAEEYDSILRYTHQIIRYPNKIYENKPGKRGAWCFVKKIRGEKYFCSIEKVREEDPSDDEKEKLYLVTTLRIRDDNYLKGYKLVWSWRGDEPSS